MNSTPNQPDDDAKKLKKLLALLDRLKEAGFVEDHLYIDDAHAIQFTERALRAVRAIRDIEASIPDLTDNERFGLWNLFRLTEEPPETGSTHRIRPFR
jgi:hypothetical protein